MAILQHTLFTGQREKGEQSAKQAKHAHQFSVLTKFVHTNIISCLCNDMRTVAVDCCNVAGLASVGVMGHRHSGYFGLRMPT